MKLNKYDNKLVRLTTFEDDVFEGICVFDNIDYNEAEYGESEESLTIQCLKFYKNSIKNVSIIDKFSSKYGLLEEVISNDGPDLIEEVLDSEDDTHILRELYYLKDHKELITDEVKVLIKELLKYNKNEDIIKEGNNLIGGSL